MGAAAGAEEAGAPAGSALPSTIPSLQRHLIRVAFRPVLPSKLVHQEASQALSRPAEAKVVRAGLQEEGRGGHGGGWDFLHPPPRDSRGEGVPRPTRSRAVGLERQPPTAALGTQRDTAHFSIRHMQGEALALLQ